MEFEDYLVTVKDLSYLGTRLITDCQLPVEWLLSYERSLVSMKKMNKWRWKKREIIGTRDLLGADVNGDN